MKVIQILHQVITKQLAPHRAEQLLHTLPVTDSDLSRVIDDLDEQYASVVKGRADPEAVKIAFLALYHRVESTADPFLLSIMSNRIGSLSCLAGKNNEGI